MNYRTYNRAPNIPWIALTIVAVIAALFIGGCYGCYQTTLKEQTETFTVEEKMRIAEENDGKWLVFATDGREFEVTDNLLKGLTNSTERYRELKVGHTYECTTIGVRWPLFSLYRNLKDCEEVG